MAAGSEARNDEAAPVGARGQLALELGHTPALAAADFLVGEGNRLAHGRVLGFAHWADPITLIVGPAKSGKSHLARIFADLSGAVFLAANDLEALATQGGSAPAIIENVDGPGYSEAALFHLLNQSMRDGRKLLLTAQQDIAQWPYQTDDVRSRARRAAMFNVAITDDIQLSQMLVKLFADRQVAVDPKIVAYVVARMERSAEEAAGLVDLMDRLALSEKTAITRSIAAEALGRRRVARGDTKTEFESEDDE
ncbi:hypothetical protein [Devosia sp.]|uniref:hypothetical protein n=1 Tax=Devosia sp. TaxID=1871048 RepID=UPI003263B925